MADGIVINVNKLDILTSFFKTFSGLIKNSKNHKEDLEIASHFNLDQIFQ